LATPNEPIKDQSQKWSCKHKPTGRLREYMVSLSANSCIGEDLHQ